MLRTIRAISVLLLFSAALLVAPAAASAQDDADFSDDTFDAITYPGPFGDSSDDADADADTSGAFSQGLPDQVLGQTVDGTDEHDDIERSIDDVGSNLGNSFVLPDIQPSSDPGAASTGGTGGGLAVTGSETEPIIAISVGLLAVGGSVLVSSRRRLRDLFL